MTLYKKVTNTPLEKIIQGQAQAELAAAGMYFTLARTAHTYGLEDVAGQFMELATQHGEQASFYFTLFGRYPLEGKKFWQFIKGLSKAEECGEKAILSLAQKMEDAGLTEHSATLKTFAAQHKYHAQVTHQLVEKYAPQEVKQNNKKRYVCSVCGYEYEGNLENEQENFICPICMMPKSVFKLK